MSEHTPTPWVAGDSEHGICPIWAKCGPLDVQPATAHGSDDAAFIVKAVNSHDALKASLAEMVGIYWGEGDGIEPPPACIRRAMAILASIEVQP